MIVVMADHGHPLGDHGRFLKGANRLYNEMLRVPFMIWLPGQWRGGQRSDALIQFQDVLPTLLDRLGLSASLNAMHGKSFRNVLEHYTDGHRPAVIIG